MVATMAAGDITGSNYAGGVAPDADLILFLVDVRDGIV